LRRKLAMSSVNIQDNKAFAERVRTLNETKTQPKSFQITLTANKADGDYYNTFKFHIPNYVQRGYRVVFVKDIPDDFVLVVLEKEN